MPLLLFFSVMAGVCEFAPAQDKSDAKAAHALYEKAIKKKKLQERLAALREASARYPQAAELHYALGREFYQLAQLDSATARFELVAALDAELTQKTNLRAIMVSAYATLASRRFGRGRLIPAVEAALAGLHHDPNSVSCLTTAMVAYQQLGEYEQALSLGLRLIALQPSARNYNNLGAAYESKGDWPAAKKYYSEALALAPHLTEVQNNLNRVNSRLNQLAATTAPARKPAEAPSKKAGDQRREAALQEVQQPLDEDSAKNTAQAATVRTAAPAPSEPKQQAPSSEPEPKKARQEQSEQPAQASPTPLPLKPAIESSPRGEVKDSARVAVPAAPTAPMQPVVSGATAYASNPALFFLICGVFGSTLIAVILWWKFFSPRALALRTSKAKPPRGARKSSNGKLPERAASEVLVASKPAIKAVTAAQAAQSAVPSGLQTEALLTEMIAGALGSFQQTEGNGHSGSETRNAIASESRAKGEDIQHVASENGALLPTPVGLVDTPPRVNGRAEVSQPASELLQQPPAEIQPGPLSPPVALPEGFDDPPREQPMDMTSMGLIAGVEEMMHEPVAGKPAKTGDAAPPAGPLTPPATAAIGDAALHLATRTMEISALGEHRIGRYLIEKEIARAATGRIYKAWDPKLDRSVVLKTVQYGFAASPQEIATMKDRIYREARAIAKLQHPNIVIVYDVDDLPEFSYLVMEYLEGRDLKQVLESERRLGWRRALYIVMQVCDAMEYAHRSGVFHRDVKPSNIMLLEDDETKVTDFGIAKISNYLSLTQTGRVMGTPSYMAPEQIEGQATDGRADLFSLGVVLYELIAGKRPFIADSLAALAYKIVHKQHIPPSLENVELPLELDEILQRALAKHPEERYQNAAGFREALRAVQAKLT
ncbi:MAG: protein kinase domain-containing protein [bacterium]